ncbi:UvrD/REP helicase [Klebsiella variicola]|uniref:UvrD-helicase domain-containing protein n=1 Tax=Klebsiella variicola TaxID=244366 RepID=UPI0007CC6785|nr:UvrD-helicase domain-containing protein [Klebsiella variicola]SBK00193.1 UvrD/REP helicase [Klebsiella variicola]
MASALVIDEFAINILLANFDLPMNWLNKFNPDDLPESIFWFKEHDSNVLYLLSKQAHEKSKLLIIDTCTSGLFDRINKKTKNDAFYRILRVGHLSMSPGKITVPTKWAPYHSGSLLSIQSSHSFNNDKGRIFFDLNPNETDHTYVYSFDNKKTDITLVNNNREIFLKAINAYEDALIALLTNDTIKNESFGTGKITLPPLQDKLTLGFNLREWLDAKLTIEQRDFVYSEIDKSIRLVGAAGTGKTLSLVVKCLYEFSKRCVQNEAVNFLFLTHNSSTVENVSQSLDIMDNELLRENNPQSKLTICTLQELANEAIKYSLNDLQPLSMDGYESRLLQVEVIESIVREFKNSDWVIFKSQCSDSFAGYIDADSRSTEFRAFAVALMNEFACVLEAEGVRRSLEKKNKYLTETRKQWMMKLNSESERRVVLHLYDKFRNQLRDMNVISADQMISDYLGYLDSNAWDNLRFKHGYDLIFVDELHLFNRQERMTFHNLMKDCDSIPKIIMAYDTKQSTYDTFCVDLSPNTNIANSLGLGQTKKFKLEKSFRYTHEIASVLEWIDNAFPALGIEDELGDDWNKITIKSENKYGDKPKLVVCDNTREIFDYVFTSADRKAKTLSQANQVAILCASEDLFLKYAEAVRYQDLFTLISDREQISSINKNKKKFILSMPEYVAGTQFDTVYLIEVNKDEVPEGSYHSSAMRKFISNIYVGASRAENTLHIFVNTDRGGPSTALKYAIENGALDIHNVKEMD